MTMRQQRRTLVFEVLVIVGIVIVLMFSEYLQITGLTRSIIGWWREES